MAVKFAAFTAAFIGLVVLHTKANACRLFCEECPQFRHIQPYYCCLENYDPVMRIKNCGSPAPLVEEWVCPKDPVIRTCNASRGQQCVYPGPRICISDSECPSYGGDREKCCYDSVINSKVCKPAIRK